MPTSLQLSPVTILAAAGVLGVTIGVGSVAWTPQGREKLATTAKTLSVAAGLQRAREPREGDFWSGCNDARSAGTAPIYRGEPGYRPEMDGDSDGIACEPYRD